MDLVGSLLMNTTRLLDPSGLHFLGWLVTAGSIGLAALIYALLRLQREAALYWTKAAREKRAAWRRSRCPSSCHSWSEDRFHGGQPSTCCVCLSSLSGSADVGVVVFEC